MRYLFATLFLCSLFSFSPAQARHLHHTGHHFKHNHHAKVSTDVSSSRRHSHIRRHHFHHVGSPRGRYGGYRTRTRGSDRAVAGDVQIVGHPSGCPGRAFCGCGVSVKIFGRPVRELYLARNWLRFPRASPGAGMVAARSGHVMAIIEYLGNGNAKVYDPNSGGHQTRIHVRSLAGYRVVNPRSG